MKILRNKALKVTVWCFVFLVFLGYRFLAGEHRYFHRAVVSLNDSGVPCVTAVIDGELCVLDLVLGSRFDAKIKSVYLEKLKKQHIGVERVKDLRGVESIKTVYRVPSIHVGSCQFQNVVTLEEKEENKSSVGYLGLGLLKKTNFILDVAESVIIFTNDKKKLKEEGYDLSCFVSCPFVLTSKGIIFEMETDLGKMRCALQTGGFWNLMHAHLCPQGEGNQPVWVSSKCMIQGKDFGAQSFTFVEMAEELKAFDGTLGMDFLKDHPFYIDFAAKMIYFKRS